LADVTSACVLVSKDSAKYIVCTVENHWPIRDRAAVSREFLQDRTAEMREISRFLHDTVSQDLVQLSFFVNKIHSEARGLPGFSETPSAIELIDRCCRDIRILSCMVAPLSLADISLHDAIELFVGHFREETGVSTTLDVDPLPVQVPLEVKFLLLRVVQMWSGRSLRIGREGTFGVRLRSLAGAAVLELEAHASTPVLRPVDFLGGWSIIRERIAVFGGTFDIDAGSDHAQARIWLPGVTQAVTLDSADI
jgi:signal transduction histidine kinase